jgi:hypothetical protein
MKLSRWIFHLCTAAALLSVLLFQSAQADLRISGKAKKSDGTEVPVVVFGDPFAKKVKAKVGNKAPEDLDCSPKNRDGNVECAKDIDGIPIKATCNGPASKDGATAAGNCEAKAGDKKLGSQSCVKNGDKLDCSSDGKVEGKPKEACESLSKMGGASAVGCTGHNDQPVTGPGCIAGSTLKVGTMVVTGLNEQRIAAQFKEKDKKEITKEKDEDKEKDKGVPHTVTFSCSGNNVIGHLKRGSTEVMRKACATSALQSAGGNATIVFLQHGDHSWSGHCDRNILSEVVRPKNEDADEWAKNLKKQDGTPHTTDLKDEKGNVVGKLTAQCNGGQKCIENPHDPSCPKSCSATVYDKDGKKINEYTFDPGKIDALKNLAKDGDTLLEKARAESEKKGPPAPTTTPPPDPGFKQRDMNEAYNKGLQDGKKQAQSQQKPQQPQQQSQQQQQRPAVPAPYCAGINAERTEITAGQSVLIRFSMPFAYSYELRGGPGTVQAGGAVVKPTETTTYFVIGTGAPGAGQISMQQGFGFDQYSYQQQMMQQQQQAGGQQCQAQLGQACCGPVTITVNPAAKATSPEVIEDEPDNSFKEETPEMTCAPEALTRGRSVTVLWKCPEGSVRSVGRAAHRDGSILTSEESFTTDRKTTGKSKKLYPDKSTEYTVYCINDRGQKSQVASCRASIVTAAAKQLAQPATKKTTTPTKTTAASSESANALRMSITASPMTIQSGSGQEVHIEWKSLNAKTCKVEGPSGYIKENTTNDSVDGSADSAGDLEFVFTCTPKDGGPPQQKKVNVVAT